MVQTLSPSSALVAFLALTSLVSESATALPTHRSSSAITRRAHLASHDVLSPNLSKRTQLGDHSVYVDASTSQPGGTGGVRNSTVNLTVISNKEKRDTTLSSFSRVVRSLFRRSPSSSSNSNSNSEKASSVFINLPPHTAAPYTQGHRTSRKQHQAAAALSRRKRSQHQKRSSSSSPSGVSPRIGVVVSRPKNSKVKRQNYSVGNEQASIYAAAVAALATPSSAPSPGITAQPVALNMNAEVEKQPITVTMTLVPGGPNGEYIDAAAQPQPTSTGSTEGMKQKRATLHARKQQVQQLKKRSLEETESTNSQQRLKRRQPNPKAPSPSPSPTPASQKKEHVATPQWTAIAKF
ncbi:uncharacterized protein JCM6883_001439 [Sporobolomyces salmoneus]|uniref:uncharacterized protein n=1 Tax=Sporobolomyces salmoneus TaxID=183962 RepID=UPI003174DE29